LLLLLLRSTAWRAGSAIHRSRAVIALINAHETGAALSRVHTSRTRSRMQSSTDVNCCAHQKKMLIVVSCTQHAGEDEAFPSNKRAETAGPADGSRGQASEVDGFQSTGPEDGALTAQEPRLAAVLGDQPAAAGSPHGGAHSVMTMRPGTMRRAASGELDARERGVVVGGWSAERAASWPTPVHKCARPTNSSLFTCFGYRLDISPVTRRLPPPLYTHRISIVSRSFWGHLNVSNTVSNQLQVGSAPGSTPSSTARMPSHKDTANFM